MARILMLVLLYRHSIGRWNQVRHLEYGKFLGEFPVYQSSLHAVCRTKQNNLRNSNTIACSPVRRYNYTYLPYWARNYNASLELRKT